MSKKYYRLKKMINQNKLNNYNVVKHKERTNKTQRLYSHYYTNGVIPQDCCVAAVEAYDDCRVPLLAGRGPLLLLF